MCRAFFAVVVFLPFGFSLHFGRVADDINFPARLTPDRYARLPLAVNHIVDTPGTCTKRLAIDD